MEPNAAAYALHGLALARTGRVIEASRSIKQALRMNPKPDSPLLMIVAYVNWGAGRIDEATVLLEQIRAENRDNVLVRLALAAKNERDGRHDEARAIMGEILRIVPDLTLERALVLIEGFQAVLQPAEFARFGDDLRAAGMP